MKPFKTLAPVDFMALCIDGPRIRLRSVHERYGEAIFREFTEEIVRYMNPVPPKTLADSLAFISQTREGMLEGADLACAILTRDAGEFLGVCGFHGRESPTTPELGIWIKKEAHGRGYGREAVVTLAGWAVQNIAFDALLYPVDRANHPSRRIPECLGGVIVKEGKAPRMNGGFLDEVVYRIPREALIRKLSERGVV
jgi:[ribosomal protein S5]-alanine N-acetyltransferase